MFAQILFPSLLLSRFPNPSPSSIVYMFVIPSPNDPNPLFPVTICPNPLLLRSRCLGLSRNAPSTTNGCLNPNQIPLHAAFWDPLQDKWTNASSFATALPWVIFGVFPASISHLVSMFTFFNVQSTTIPFSWSQPLRHHARKFSRLPHLRSSVTTLCAE